MSTSQWLANHAMNAKVFFIKLPLVKQLTDDFPLLISATEFRHVPGIFHHCKRVEIGCKGVKDDKQDIQNEMGRPCHC